MEKEQPQPVDCRALLQKRFPGVFSDGSILSLAMGPDTFLSRDNKHASVQIFCRNSAEMSVKLIDTPDQLELSVNKKSGDLDIFRMIICWKKEPLSQGVFTLSEAEITLSNGYYFLHTNIPVAQYIPLISVPVAVAQVYDDRLIASGLAMHIPLTISNKPLEVA